jgi:hypothetical protein
MKYVFQLSSLAIALVVGGCGLHNMGHPEPEGIKGETVSEVASSLARMQGNLSPKKAEEFSHAVDTLTRVTPDKFDSRTVGEMSPQFVAMVRGRNADQIIQLAVLFRGAAPPDRKRR